MGLKPKRNDPCPYCDSGKKYKNCHLHRDKQKPLPGAAIHNLSERARGLEVCLHPEACEDSCNEKIARAHSIQRSKVLETIVDKKNKVRQIRPSSRDDEGFVVNRVGWHEASTFKGFCGKHDTELFRPLEGSNLFTGSSEQCFLLAYRAFCHEHHLKRDTVPAIKVIRDLVDRGKSIEDQIEIQARAALYQQAHEFAVGEQQTEKQRLDAELMSQNYKDWSHWIVYAEGKPDVLCSQYFHPGVDLNGRRLQRIEDYSTPIEPMCINTVVVGEALAYVFSWRKSNKSAKKFLQIPFDVSSAVLPHMILLIIFTRCENVFFSSEWWNHLAPESKRMIEKYCSMCDDLDWMSPVDAIGIASWEIERVKNINL